MRQDDPMARKTATAPADPDKLVRQPDGSYVSGDGRYDVEQSNGSWFVADHEMADDFGQPRVVGPIATLKLVKEAIPRLREGPTPIRKPIRQARRSAAKSARPPANEKPKPTTWLDRLPDDRRKLAARLVRALEREGLDDAEGAARSFIERGDGADPRPLARRLLGARLDRLRADGDDAARQLIGEVLRVVTGEGTSTGRDLPGWTLVALEPDGTITDLRIELD